MNFVETCRKGAGWPALHRDVPVKGDNKKVWSLSQEEVAAFVGQVRTRSTDLQAEVQAKTDRISKLSDEKAELVREIARLQAKLFAYEAHKAIKRTAEALDLDASQSKALETAVATASK